jgi:hypothetical protein
MFVEPISHVPLSTLWGTIKSCGHIGFLETEPTRQKFAFAPYNLSWALFIWILLSLSMISVLAIHADFHGDFHNRHQYY